MFGDVAPIIGQVDGTAEQHFAGSQRRAPGDRTAIQVDDILIAPWDKRIIAELGFYQWNHEVAVIGADLAKYVFGVRAQAVRDILIDEGLNPAAYKFLSHDEWIDEDTGEAKDRYGVQLESLALFLIAAQETRLAALEERIATLATP